MDILIANVINDMSAWFISIIRFSIQLFSVRVDTGLISKWSGFIVHGIFYGGAWGSIMI